MPFIATSHSLPPIWRCQPDPFDEGERLGWHQPDLDTAGWREARIPGTFETAMPDVEDYIGAVWFRTVFTLDPDTARHPHQIVFGACNNSARVYLNGHLIGTHDDAYTPFTVNASPAVRTGVNVLSVRVTNDFAFGALPGYPGGWRAYGGILRSVHRRAMPAVHLGDISACGRMDGRLPLQGCLINQSTQPQAAGLRVTLHDPQGAMLLDQTWDFDLAPGETPVALEPQVADIMPWSPDQPVCYRVTIVLESPDGVDTTCFRTGFRTLTTQGAELLLNGQPLRLRGMNRHEDSPQRQAAADPQQARRDLEMIKATGANFVRLAHYPHDPSTLDCCDDIGLLAMAEIPLYWWHGKSAGDDYYAASRAAAHRMLRAMIQRDRHHACIMAWSVGNENAEERPEVVEGLTGLLTAARSLDPDRPAVHVAHHWDKHAHFDHDDLICLNAYPSYEGRCAPANPAYDPAEATAWWRRELDRLHQRYPRKPILITEYGHPAWQGTQGYGIGDDTQTAAIEAETAAFNQPFVCGYAIWCFADHPWPHADYLKRNSISSYGLWTRQRFPKRAVARLPQWFNATPPTPPPATTSDNQPVFMIRPDFEDVPRATFPAGFSLRPLRAGEEGLWEDVQRDAEPFFTIPPGLFVQEFGDDLPATRYRCLLVIGPRDCVVGTCSAWYSRDYYEIDTGRIHWLAIRPAYQGQGLAKAALLETLRIMSQWHSQAWLATSTGRIPAIRLYLNAGFQPDLRPDGALATWQRYREHNPHPALATLDKA